MPLNPLYTAHELGAIFEDAAPAVLVVDAVLAAMAEPLARRAGVAHVVIVGEGARRLDERPAGDADLPPVPATQALALLQYTGGTTGRAKGVELTHGAIAVNVAQREALLPTRSGDRILCMMPLSHAYAMSMGLFLSLNCAGTLVILARYQPDEVLAAVTHERIGVFLGSPTIFTGLLAHPGFAASDWHTVHTCYSGSAALAESTLARWREAVGAPVYEGYGLTEAGPVLTFNPVRGPVKAGSVGVPVPLTEIEVVDVETGEKVLPAGSRGEIRARGPQLMRGYRNRLGGNVAGVARRLAVHRRHRRVRRRRLPRHPGPQEGHGERRRLQRLSARGRGGAVFAPRCGRRRGDWPARLLSRRSPGGLCGATVRRTAPCRNAAGALPRTPGQIQIARAVALRHRAAQDAGQQDRQERITEIMSMTQTRFANPLLEPSTRPAPRRVAVIGAGTIGPDIGYYLKAALPGLELVLLDVRQAAVDAALARLKGYADKAVARGKMSEKAAQATLAGLTGSTDYEVLRGCDWVIEAATEDMALKRRIFADVEARVDATAAITSNTSSLPAQRIFSEMAHPERATVTHFFAPAWRNPVVEVIDWPGADPALLAWLRRLFAQTGKLPLVTADAPCFMLDRVFDNWCNEAALLLGEASAAQIDSVAAEFVHAGPFFVLNLAHGNPIIIETNTLQAAEEGAALPAGRGVPLGRALAHGGAGPRDRSGASRCARASATACWACCCRRASTSWTAASAAPPISTSAAAWRWDFAVGRWS